MNHFFLKAGRAAALSSVALLGIGLLSSAVGMRINTSRSIPLGMYWTSASPVGKGSYVFFCPPHMAVMAQARQRGYLDTGRCPGGYGYMMKKVVAVGGDIVVVSKRGVSVNGTLLPLSAPLAYDRSGRPLPRIARADFVVGVSEVWLMSDVSATSFDSRYYGPIDRLQIKDVVIPVVTW